MTGPYQLLGRAEGTAECAVTGAMPALFLNKCAAADVFLRFAEPVDETELRVILSQKDLSRAQALARRSQCELRVLRRRGGKALGKRLARRARMRGRRCATSRHRASDRPSGHCRARRRRR